MSTGSETSPDLPAPSFLHLSVRPDPSGTTVELHGELDTQTARRVTDLVDEGIDQDRVHLRLDLSDLRFMDLDGFDALCDAHRRLQGRGGGLQLVRYAPIVARLAQVCAAEHLLGERREAGAGGPR